jgi:hypothetical protein
LRGGDRITSRHDRYIGLRTLADWWLGEEGDIALEADAFFLERDSTHFTAYTGNVPVLAIPFYGVRAGQQLSYVVSGFNPDFGNLIGGTTIYSRMELFGQEANVLWNLFRSPCQEWNLIAGARFLQLRERLDLTSTSRVLPEQSTLIGLEDHFQTFDKFYGGQVGVKGMRWWGRWFVEGKAAVSLGADDQEIRSKGTRIFQTPQERQQLDYGLFVLPSNRGSFEHMSLDVVTDVRINVGFDVTRHLRLLAGYSFLTWAGPVRPGSQVQPINQSQVRQPGGLVGIATPLPNFHEDFFWAHGASAGLEFRW